MSSKAGDAIHLDEMIEAGERLAAHLRRTSEDAFVEDAVVYDAVCMCLLRIGEGARLLSPEAKAALAEIPWPDVVALRHRIAHGYGHLHGSVIWMTATKSVPPLIVALRGLRARIGTD